MKTSMVTLLLVVLVGATTTASPQPRRPPAVEEFILVPSDDYDTERDSWFGGIPQWFNFFNIRDIMASFNPLRYIPDISNKGNTTSETQVMNGTIITRNVTTYVDKETGTIVHVSSVDIRPSEKTPDEVEDVTSTADVGPANKEPESTEEIESNPAVDVADIDAPTRETNEIPNDKKPAEEPTLLSARPVDYYAKRNYIYPDINNDIEVFADNNPIDLQNDVYVNSVLEEKIRQSGGMHQLDPDVELIDVTGGRVVESFPNTQIQSRSMYFPDELQS